MKRGWLKNTALATILSTTLTACGGGGGGGGAVGTVTNFVKNDLASLSGTTDLISTANQIVESYEQQSQNNEVSIENVLATFMSFGSYTPDADDQTEAEKLLSTVDAAISWWNNVEDVIATTTSYTDKNGNEVSFTDKDRMSFYQLESYKEAAKAIRYLKDVAKPVIEKVKLGNTITDDEVTNITSTSRYDEIVASYDAEVTEAVELKKQNLITFNTKTVTLTPVLKSDNDVAQTNKATSSPSDAEEGWEYVNGAGGKQTRDVTTTTPNVNIKVYEDCEEVRQIYKDGSYKVISSDCSDRTVTNSLASTITVVTEERMGENYVTNTEDVSEDPVDEWLTQNVKQKTTTYEDSEETISEEVEGMATTTTEDRYVVSTVDNDDNTSTETKIKYTDTIVTTPVTTIVYKDRTYTHVYTTDKKLQRTSTKVTKEYYADGTDNTITEDPVITYPNGDSWVTTEVKRETETERVEVSRSTVDRVEKTEGTDGTMVAGYPKIIPNDYTDKDQNLGTQTVGLSTNPDDFKTAEFNKDSSKSMINADKAYARGWTGKGSVLGVIDSYQQTDHEALDGKYKWYNDYVRYEDGTTDENGNELGTVANGGKNISHGTHVAGIIAGKRDGTQFHGVAFDAELVGANIDYHGSGAPHMSYATSALKDIAKLKSTEAQGGEGMNIVAVNMSFNRANANFHYGEITQLSDGTYTASKITDRMNGGGGAQYWRVGTDNDIVLVNSAGNGIYKDGEMNYDFSLDPGIYATEVDNAGNLVLGGKMIIVGNWGGTKAEGQVVGSKAGHVCLDIDTINNICNDQYKVSDFYILAPGNSVYSSVPGDGYATMGGSSMAAPQVTGAMGILHQMWPHMKGENLVKLVLNTADKDINNYNVNIHGQGMLDLDEATKPQGAIGIPTTGRVDGATAGLNSTYFATGTGSAFSALGDVKIMVLDDYDRDYYINLGDTFTVKDNRKYSDTAMLVNNNHSFLPTQQMYGSFSQGGQWDLVKDYNFGFYTGENGNGDYSTNIGKNFFITDRFKLKTSVGTMSEQETWLGNSSDGVLAVGDNNNTNFGNIGVDYQIGNNVLSFDYTRGKTDINTVDNSLIKSFSDVRTESYRLAYEIHKDKHNTLGWSFSLPSHITSGTMDLEVAESVNLDGTINYTNITSDLTQSTKEKNIGFYLNHTPTHDTDASYNFTAEYRQDVAGQSGRDGINLAMNYTKKFWGSCKFLWMKNPKCYTKDENGKEVLTAESNALMFGNNNVDPATKLGLRYDMKTDMFVPINPEDKKWKQ